MTRKKSTLKKMGRGGWGIHVPAEKILRADAAEKEVPDAVHVFEALAGEEILVPPCVIRVPTIHPTVRGCFTALPPEEFEKSCPGCGEHNVFLVFDRDLLDPTGKPHQYTLSPKRDALQAMVILDR
ncbi:MAG: hypothetical protein ABH851_02690 [Methanobacteriota archaeon]